MRIPDGGIPGARPALPLFCGGTRGRADSENIALSVSNDSYGHSGGLHALESDITSHKALMNIAVDPTYV